MNNWRRKGIFWGAILYGITIFGFPLLSGEKLSFFKIIFGIPLWIITGLALGYLLKDRNKTKATARPKKKR